MTKKHKIINIILILVLCSIFISEEKINSHANITDSRVNLQMENINKHNILSRDSGIKYIGHRGIGGLAPENTLPAFDLAGKMGFWGAECDVHTTRDGNWMILHDDTVNRMTNGTGQIKNLSYSKIQELNITSGNNIASYKGIKIPTLQDYLLTCKKWELIPVIEMKPSDNLKYYDKFLKILKEYGNIEKDVVISYSMVSLNELRKRDINLTLGLICSNITDSNIYYVRTLGNAFIDCSSSNITRSEVVSCHKNGIKVGAWTVDSIVLANSLIQKGVDYLTTNKLLPKADIQEVSNKF